MHSTQGDLEINFPSYPKAQPKNSDANKVRGEDKSVHEWYRFVLSFPPHLVRDYISKFGLDQRSVLLDPFCGTGTTVVEGKLNGIKTIGLEANPLAYFASKTKTNWSIDPDDLLERSRLVAQKAKKSLLAEGIKDNAANNNIEEMCLRDLGEEKMRLILANSISPLPLHKSLTLLECINQQESSSVIAHQKLALAKSLVSKISNLKFGPEVGVSRKKKIDVCVTEKWLDEVEKMASDISALGNAFYPESDIFLADSRSIPQAIAPNSVDAVITSPPYPNEKDYSRTTRLESVFLGYINNKEDLRNIKKSLIRSNTRGVYKGDCDDSWISHHNEIMLLANEIEAKRIELNKTSGFEKLYSTVTRLYFGGMAKHLSELRHVLRPGAQLAYVVGDQASYFRVRIKTGELLAEVAEHLGYEVSSIDLFRTRFATATKEELREEVLVLRWPGN